MYLEHYGLNEAPFSITPDPRYVFLSDRHREALAHLLYGVGKGGGSGFVQLTGEVGTGKTTLCRLLLEQLPEDTRVALILNPKLGPVELLAAICEELDVQVDAGSRDQKTLVDALNHYLLDAYAQGIRVVLIVDEAQELSVASLEQVRLLTNLETPTQKLLQIILLGQPELRELLDKPELRQLAQRITARYHLEPLDSEETAAYVRHRLEVAGLKAAPFTRLAMAAVYRRSGGIPRVINIVADRALTAGYAQDKDKITERMVHQAANEALPGHMRHWWLRLRYPLAAVLVLLLAGSAWWLMRQPTAVPATPVPVVESAEPDAAERLAAAMAAPSEDAGDNAAWSALLARWQVDAGEASVAAARQCPAVVAPGLRCLEGRGSLRQVVQFNRPVILFLRADNAQDHAALLLGSGQQQIRLLYQGREYSLSQDWLLQVWDGRFVTIFRVPPMLPVTLQQGSAGPATAWVAQQLALFDAGDERAHGPSFYDAALEARVRRLQQGFGLKPDGIVGLETSFALASLSTSGPHLAHGVP